MWLPTLIIFVLALTIAQIFMMLIDVAVDVVYMCYLVDIDKNPEGAQFGTTKLQGNQKKLKDLVKDAQEEKDDKICPREDRMTMDNPGPGSKVRKKKKKKKK